jgi:hypothetical protein
VPYQILQYYIKGRPSGTSIRANSHQLTTNKEERLSEWIANLDKRRLPPHPAFVGNIANYLLAQCNDQAPPP